ncbi:hypothetical protein FIBSPDRAFT_937803 [Athelia psychrophila]|uniref:DUF6589 domain-containing protein n=1 Tax=Athelia psychrophila TaxID=1759441 RepID=A0A165ZR78_9AGAM|nr:hypothetical protein FIBSPDRAFT_937803 [Fibularhizoctonia sp. CBS 109695]
MCRMESRLRSRRPAENEGSSIPLFLSILTSAFLSGRRQAFLSEQQRADWPAIPERTRPDALRPRAAHQRAPVLSSASITSSGRVAAAMELRTQEQEKVARFMAARGREQKQQGELAVHRITRLIAQQRGLALTQDSIGRLIDPRSSEHSSNMHAAAPELVHWDAIPMRPPSPAQQHTEPNADDGRDELQQALKETVDRMGMVALGNAFELRYLRHPRSIEEAIATIFGCVKPPHSNGMLKHGHHESQRRVCQTIQYRQPIIRQASRSRGAGKGHRHCAWGPDLGQNDKMHNGTAATFVVLEDYNVKVALNPEPLRKARAEERKQFKISVLYKRVRWGQLESAMALHSLCFLVQEVPSLAEHGYDMFALQDHDGYAPPAKGTQDEASPSRHWAQSAVEKLRILTNFLRTPTAYTAIIAHAPSGFCAMNILGRKVKNSDRPNYYPAQHIVFGTLKAEAIDCWRVKFGVSDLNQHFKDHPANYEDVLGDTHALCQLHMSENLAENALLTNSSCPAQFPGGKKWTQTARVPGPDDEGEVPFEGINMLDYEFRCAMSDGYIGRAVNVMPELIKNNRLCTLSGIDGYSFVMDLLQDKNMAHRRDSDFGGAKDAVKSAVRLVETGDAHHRTLKETGLWPTWMNISGYAQDDL